MRRLADEPRTCMNSSSNTRGVSPSACLPPNPLGSELEDLESGQGLMIGEAAWGCGDS